MDNDLKFIRHLKKLVKTIKFKFDYKGYSITDSEIGNDIIKVIIKNANPAMVARGGAVELRCVKEYLSSGRFSDNIKKEIQICAGVFPATDDVLKRFCEYYMDCMSKADLLALWGVGAESTVVKKYCFNSKFTELQALEPYYYNDPWSSGLCDKRVLVIHPFVDTIKKQYLIREKLFDNSNVLPDFESLICIKAVQSNAGEITEYKDWFEALESMKQQIKNIDFDVAIIGAGAYSLPLAAYVKDCGKIAVQMSGATQILFGIKGKRWDNMPEVSKYYNGFWKRPSEEETPIGSKLIEGGSYW